MELDMEITNELLAAYAEGNVTEPERNAVRQYLTDNPNELETMLMMMDEDYDLNTDVPLNNSTEYILDTTGHADRTGFNQRLNDLLDDIDALAPATNPPAVSILPIMSKAARNKSDNSCVVRCEGYALRTLGIDISDVELESEAEKQGLLKDEGTALYNIGQLSAQYGLFVSRKYGCAIGDVLKSIKHGDVVIAVVDNTELSLDPAEAERIDRLYGELPNHALIIKSIDEEQNTVTLLNPGEKEEIHSYPLDVFIEAWDDSANYLVISNRNHYKPHPIDLSDMSLDEDIIQLQDVFAENLHEVWAKERKKEGWTYGTDYDNAEKTDPNMLPYDLLPQNEKEKCRQMALESIKLLKKLGW